MGVKNTNFRRVSIAGIFLAVLFIGVSGVYAFQSGDDQHIYDAELAFADLSPNGEAGGKILPASCESGFVFHMENTTGDPNFCANLLTFSADSTSLPYGGATTLRWNMPTGDVNNPPSQWYSNRGYAPILGGWNLLPEDSQIQSCMGSGATEGAWNVERYTEPTAVTPGTQYAYLGTMDGYYWYAREEVVGTGALTSTQTYTLTCVVLYQDAVGTVTKSVTVNVAPVATYTITTSVSGSGSVSASPADNSSKTNCVSPGCTYNSGTNVTLTATPSAGYTFTGWSGGGCSGTGTCGVIVTGNLAVTAIFGLSPAASITIYRGPFVPGFVGVHDITLTTLDQNTKVWSDNNTGTSWSSTYSVANDVARGTTCPFAGNNGIWTPANNSAGGWSTGIVSANYEGCITTITYTVTNSVGAANDIINIAVVAPAATNLISDIAPTVTGVLTQGNPVTFNGRARNNGTLSIGTAFTDNFTYCWGAACSPSSMIDGHITKTVPFAAGATQDDTSASFTLTNTGTLRVQHCVDSQGAIVESDETWADNCRVTDFTVTATPTVTSPTATSITSTGATLGANVTSTGGATLTARGTCWGTTPSPTTNCLAQGGLTTGIFTHARTGMPPGTTIYYRGYATNSVGTGYSADGTFTTLGTYILTGNSSGASSIVITSATGHGGTTNYTRSGITSGTTATLTAPATSGGATFSSWSGTGCASASQTISVSMTANRTCTANYTANIYTVSTSASSGGTITPSSQMVTYNDTASFTVTPNSGYDIGTVSGCGGSLSGNTYTTGPITANCTVSATFTLQTGCAYGTDSLGNLLTNLDAYDRTSAEQNGKYQVTKWPPTRCFGNTGSSRYLIPLGSQFEFDSFWNNIEAGNNLPSLYRIP